jgi:hypothetical protein
VATRRKYKTPVDPGPVTENVPPLTARARPDAPEAPGPSDEANPLLRALQAAQHAEALQHQRAQRQQIGLPEPQISPADRQAIDAHVDHMAGLTDYKRRFLKSHPSLLTEPYVKLVAHAYQIALHAGVADDTPAMDHAVLTGAVRDIEHHRQLSHLTSADAQPTPENHQAHHDVNRHAEALQQEAESLLAESGPQQQPPAPRRKFAMQAPVSRDVPLASGHRQTQGSNTLSAAEVEIAHNSFTDPRLSNHEKELMYLKNRQKLHRMRADGSYSEQRG